MKAMKNLEKCAEGFKMQDLSTVGDYQDEICEGRVTEKLSVKPFTRSSRGEVNCIAPTYSQRRDEANGDQVVRRSKICGDIS